MKNLLLILLTPILLSSCATLFSRSKDTIHFTSKPTGPLIYKDVIEICTTPCSYDFKRKLSKTKLEFELDGYQTKLITLDKQFNVVSVLNLGNLWGWGIDLISGSIVKYDRKSYNVTLKLDKTSSLLETKRINIDSENKTVQLIVQK